MRARSAHRTRSRRDRRLLARLVVTSIEARRRGALPLIAEETSRHPRLAREIARQMEIVGWLEEDGASCARPGEKSGIERIAQHFSRLEPWLQGSILLHDLAEMGWSEISKAVGVPPGMLRRLQARVIEDLVALASR